MACTSVLNFNRTNCRIPVHLFAYCLLLFKNETLITMHPIHTLISGRVFCNLALQPVDNNRVRFLLSKLCISTATGLDMISARLLRECTDLISSSICEISNLSIVTGVFPEEWKCSKAIALFKQGERADMNYYRPISVIPVVAKVFERIMYDLLYAYLSENDMIAAKQSAF